MFLLFTNIISTLGTYHQVFKIHKAREAKNISKFNIGSVWTNISANLIYATTLKNSLLMFTFGNSWIAMSLLLGSVLKFSNENNNDSILLKKKNKINFK